MKKTKQQIEEQKRMDYFAGLFMQSLIHKSNYGFSAQDICVLAKQAKYSAKELINVLDNE